MNSQNVRFAQWSQFNKWSDEYSKKRESRTITNSAERAYGMCATRLIFSTEFSGLFSNDSAPS